MTKSLLDKLPTNERYDIVRHVKDTFDSYEQDLSGYHNTLMSIYREVNKTEETKNNEWDTTFYVNKMREVENKVTPKIMAKNPRFIVSWRTDAWEYGDEDLSEEEKVKKMENKRDLPVALQDYLTQMFEKQEIRKKFKLFAKSGVRYGIGWAKVKYDYNVARKVDKKGAKEETRDGYPCIGIKSFSDMYFDPRYTTLDEMPAIIEIARNVRISELEASGKYDQEILDELKEIITTKDPTLKNELIEKYAGITQNEVAEPDLHNLELKIYEGYWGDEDKFIRATTVSDYLLIGYEEITWFSYEEFRVFEDTETFLAKGFIEPIMGLQRELNWKKNAASEYINNALHRTWVLSPTSGIDPADLYSWPWHVIIPDAISASEVVTNHLLELPHRQLDMQYFNEQNDFERQIQAATHTIDIANRSPWVGQTNTATGEKIQYAEMNDVVNDVRQSFEDALSRIAYKLLETTYENMESNIYFKSADGKKFWKLHKEAFADALRRFDIRVEANSSSSLDVESRRQDAIAIKNIAGELMQMGAKVDINEVAKKIFSTFEWLDVNKLIDMNSLQSLIPPTQPWQEQVPTNPLAVPPPPWIWSIQ